MSSALKTISGASSKPLEFAQQVAEFIESVKESEADSVS